MESIALKTLADIPIDPWPQSMLHSLSFASNATRFFDQQQQKHGDIYRCRLMGCEYVRVHGPQFAELIYRNSDDIIVNAPAWRGNIGDFSPNGQPMHDTQNHMTHRRIMLHAFNRNAMQAYFLKIRAFANEAVNELQTMESVNFYPYIKEQTLSLALRLFLGIEFRETLGQEVATALINMINAAVAILRKPMLNNRYQRGLAGRKVLQQAFGQLVRARRQTPKPDLISYLCQAQDENGQHLTNEQIVEHLIFTMMATHDTTASTLTSALYFLTIHPRWQNELHSEVKPLNRSLTYPSLTQLTKTEAVIKETIRLFPPRLSTPRLLQKEITVNDYCIPANTLTGINIHRTHRDPNYWTEPDTFNPERFLMQEDRQHPYQFIPFGGGVHKCIGMQQSLMESKVFLSELLSRLTIQRVSRHKAEFTAIPIWQPKGRFELSFEPGIDGYST